jgi:hypothetical protein
MFLDQMATELGPHIGQQAEKCEISDTVMEVFLLLYPPGEVVMTYLRVGNSYLTHSHLLSGNVLPVYM